MTSASMLVAAGILIPGLSLGQLRIGPDELPLAAKGLHYSVPFYTYVDGRCDRGNASLSLTGGTLPKGLALEASGLEGVPREIGLFHFTIRAENLCAVATRAFEMTVTGRPILEAAPDEIAFACLTHGPAPAPKTILVSGTWPSLPYRAEARNADWLRVKQGFGVTPDPDSAMTGDVVTLTVDVAKLEPGTYRGWVLFRTRNGANAPAVPVVLVVGSPKDGNAAPVSTHEAAPAHQ